MTAIIIISVACQAAVFWHIGRGRVVYPLLCATYVLYSIVEGWIAYRDPAQSAVWLYVALNLWCLSRAVVGWKKKGAVCSD